MSNSYSVDNEAIDDARNAINDRDRLIGDLRKAFKNLTAATAEMSNAYDVWLAVMRWNKTDELEAAIDRMDAAIEALRIAAEPSP